ncbi:MAG TPA: ferredoxin [Thermoanaerobaculia bacterium]
MSETLSTPAAAGRETPSRADLRRFHHGDPRARGGELPPGLLPAALHRYRGVAASGDWPLVVGAGEPFARPLGPALAALAASAEDRVLADLAPHLERAVARRLAGGSAPLAAALAEAVAATAQELALPAADAERLAASARAFAVAAGEEASVLGFGAAAVWRLADIAARRAARRVRAELAASTRELVAAADALLEADGGRRAGVAPGARRLGALGGRFVDAGRLSEVVAHRRVGEPLADERRAGLEAARTLLAELPHDAPEPRWIVPPSFAPLGLGGTPFLAEDPCAEACAVFDRAAEQAAARVRAARRVTLEAAGAFDPEHHLPGLERLDWRGFEPHELALVPAVFAVVRARDLLVTGLQSFTRLLLSGRPVQIVVPAGDGYENGGPALERFEPGYLGLGHREVYVHQGSIARGAALAEGLARGLAAARPALHVVDLPSSGPAELDPWLVASARVSGRAAPLYRYQPEAGTTWARRLRFDDNPEAAADWPREPLPPSNGTAAPAEAAFTFADAALLDPAWHSHFALAPVDGDDLVALADWLEAPAEAAARTLPFVWSATAEGELVRLVVSRALAWATRDRRELWRTLAELAGVRSEHVDEAVAAARRELAEKAAREREELAAAHAAEIERVRGEAAAGAVSRIVAGLLADDGDLLAAIAEPAPAAAPGLAAAAPAAPTREPAPAAAPAAEAWLDSALCTSCDDCTRKFPGIFAYNADKQAYVKNPRGGSFRDLVRAAEACPARVIHPGQPWDAKEKDLASWIERAEKFD